MVANATETKRKVLAERQHFTSKERDLETGLDYFGARYYASMWPAPKIRPRHRSHEVAQFPQVYPFAPPQRSEVGEMHKAPN